MSFIGLSDAEYEVMELLWSKGRPLCFREIMEHFENNTDKDWKKQTLNTHLSHLIEKQVLAAEGEARKIYRPAISKKAYKHQKAKNTVARFFGGSLNNFVAAFCDDAECSAEEIEELQKMLDEKKKTLNK